MFYEDKNRRINIDEVIFLGKEDLSEKFLIKLNETTEYGFDNIVERDEVYDNILKLWKESHVVNKNVPPLEPQILTEGGW